MENVLQPLLLPSEPGGVKIVNGDAPGPFVLTGDHAGNAIPAALGNLGVGQADRARHIGLDIGIEALGHDLSERLGAVFIHQHYSRLVVDCNRDPGAADAMPAVSDRTPVPGNATLDAEGRRQRAAEIHEPYQQAIAALLAGRDHEEMATLVALHSFTPSLAGDRRPWEIGILHAGHNDAFARGLMAWLALQPGLVVGDNEPYRMDTIDYTVPRHAFSVGRPYVEIEVRQDLLGDEAGVARIAALLADGLRAALGAG